MNINQAPVERDTLGGIYFDFDNQDIGDLLLDFSVNDIVHEDFTNSDGSSQIVYVEPGINTNPSMDHGTAVAGCTAAATNNGVGISSIGYNCKLRLYIGSYNDMTQAAADGANIINCSWRLCTYDNDDQLAIDMIHDQGVVIVAGAGNGNVGAHCSGGPNVGAGSNYNGYCYPASYNHVISVSSVTLGDDYEQGLQMHTYNDKVDVTSPGFHVPGLTNSGSGTNNSGYNYGMDGWWGTSFASPITAGLCGLILSINPCLSPDEVEYILKTSADDISSTGNNASYTGYCGSGRINACAAVQMAQNYNQDITISTSTTWNTDISIFGNAKIETGSTLTITGNAYFGENAKLIVEHGAKLIIDGGLLTNSVGCGDNFWEGIVLEGEVNTPQGSINNTAQPVVIVSNGASIEGAEIGILSDHGGIIVADECTFRNNMRAIKFTHFQNTTLSGNYDKRNISSFNKCTFTVDDDYIGQTGYLTQFHEHVLLQNVDGITFKECHFEDEISVNYYEIWQDRGIVTDNAGFSVDCNCDIPLAVGQECPDQYIHKSTFKNLLAGVHVVNGEKPVRITNCEFEDNIVGIFLSVNSYPVVTRNEFIIGNTPLLNNYQQKHAIAIKAQRITGYQIEENVINYSPTPHPDYWSFGIVVDYSGAENNEVYKNELNDIEYGINPLNSNRNDDGTSGLQVLCNEFESLIAGDIVIDLASPFSTVPDPMGIRLYQGNPDNGMSAGNCFTMNIGVTDGNISNSQTGNPIIYLCPCINNCTDCYYPYEKTPVYVAVAQSNITNSCPSHLTNGFVYPMDPSILATTKSNYYSSKTAYYNLLYSYYQQLDGGNTPAVLLEIQNTWPQEAWDLRNDLMAMAPFVSRDALE